MTRKPETMTTQATSPLEPKLPIGTKDQMASSPVDLNKTAVFDALNGTGITQIVVSFDGYGDSGQIEDICASNGEEPVPMPDRMVEFLTITWPQSGPSRSGVGFAAAVENLAYDVLAQTHCGWENNDGAYGNIVFDAAARTITLDYNERYTESKNFTHTL